MNTLQSQQSLDDAFESLSVSVLKCKDDRDRLLSICKKIYEHFDDIADGAPDASYAARIACAFLPSLKDAIVSAESSPVSRSVKIGGEKLQPSNSPDQI